MIARSLTSAASIPGPGSARRTRAATRSAQRPTIQSCWITDAEDLVVKVCVSAPENRLAARAT